MSYTNFSSRFTNAANAVIDYSKMRAVQQTEYSSEIPYHTDQLFKIITSLVKKQKLRILDLTSHVGGFVLPWAKRRPQDKITAVEIADDAYACLQYNTRILGLKNVTPVHADSAEYIKSLGTEKIDMVYMDPPWGGPDYKYKKTMQLYLGKLSAPAVIAKLFQSSVDWVFFKAPNNYDLQSLPFQYKIFKITSANRNKSTPDYLLICINRNSRAGSVKRKKSTKKKK